MLCFFGIMVGPISWVEEKDWSIVVPAIEGMTQQLEFYGDVLPLPYVVRGLLTLFESIIKLP